MKFVTLIGTASRRPRRDLDTSQATARDPSLAWIVLGLLSLLLWHHDARAADATSASPVAQSVVVRHVRVFDGQRVRDDTDVLVVQGRIAGVGASLAAPAGTPVVDGRGRTLLPGLIDAHVHAYGSAQHDALRFGVTTELDMFSDWHQIAAAVQQRQSLAPTAQADLWSAGTLATVPRGHGTEYGFAIPTLTRPEEADAFVQARLAEGSDYVKIILEDGSAYGVTIPSLDEPTVAALVKAAHAAHKLAVAHVATQDEARQAIEAGVDGLAHVFFDQPASPEIVRLARDRHVFVVATLSVAATVAGADNGDVLAADPRLKDWLTSAQGDALRARFPGNRQRPMLLANAIENVRRLHAAGVPILAGTDAGNPGTTHGASLHGELALLVQAGLTPLEALSAATTLPVDKFSLGDRGRIATGQRADLLLVDGDPTTDITATRAIVMVWKNGAVVDRALTPAERAAPVVAAAPQAPAGPLIADFETGELATRFGQNWTVTTDQLAGGHSVATEVWEAGGAKGSKGAMRVTGTVAPELPYAWAGTLFMPGAKPFDAVDFSSRKTLVFQIRGEARGLSAMIFSGSANNRMPAVVPFAVTPQWTEVRIPLDRFQGADPIRIRGMAITAGLPAGPFSFEIDDIMIE